MSAELDRSEADARGVRRVLCDQIDEAIGLLHSRRITDEEIHSARKSLKKARASLRLLRAAVPARVYERGNATLRDVARPLSAARDAKVLLDALERLAKLYGSPATQSIPVAFKRQLGRERAASRGAVTRGYSDHAAPLRNLRAARKTLVASRLHANGWKELGLGLAKVYRRGRKAMKRARKEPSPESLHEWRKQSKYLWHALQMLEPMWPGPIGALADQVHKLSDYLGDDHDLAVLRAKASAHAEHFPPPSGPGALLALIDRCQERLRARAFFAGRRIYDESPAAFTKRFERYWKRWNAEAPARDA